MNKETERILSRKFLFYCLLSGVLFTGLIFSCSYIQSRGITESEKFSVDYKLRQSPHPIRFDTLYRLKTKKVEDYLIQRVARKAQKKDDIVLPELFNLCIEYGVFKQIPKQVLWDALIDMHKYRPRIGLYTDDRTGVKRILSDHTEFLMEKLRNNLRNPSTLSQDEVPVFFNLLGVLSESYDQRPKVITLLLELLKNDHPVTLRTSHRNEINTTLGHMALDLMNVLLQLPVKSISFDVEKPSYNQSVVERLETHWKEIKDQPEHDQLRLNIKLGIDLLKTAPELVDLQWLHLYTGKQFSSNEVRKWEIWWSDAQNQHPGTYWCRKIRDVSSNDSIRFKNQDDRDVLRNINWPLSWTEKKALFNQRKLLTNESVHVQKPLLYHAEEGNYLLSEIQMPTIASDQFGFWTTDKERYAGYDAFIQNHISLPSHIEVYFAYHLNSYPDVRVPVGARVPIQEDGTFSYTTEITGDPKLVGPTRTTTASKFSYCWPSSRVLNVPWHQNVHSFSNKKKINVQGKIEISERDDKFAFKVDFSAALKGYHDDEEGGTNRIEFEEDKTLYRHRTRFGMTRTVVEAGFDNSQKPGVIRGFGMCFLPERFETIQRNPRTTSAVKNKPFEHPKKQLKRRIASSLKQIKSLIKKHNYKGVEVIPRTALDAAAFLSVPEAEEILKWFHQNEVNVVFADEKKKTHLKALLLTGRLENPVPFWNEIQGLRGNLKDAYQFQLLRLYEPDQLSTETISSTVRPDMDTRTTRSLHTLMSRNKKLRENYPDVWQKIQKKDAPNVDDSATYLNFLGVMQEKSHLLTFGLLFLIGIPICLATDQTGLDMIKMSRAALIGLVLISCSIPFLYLQFLYFDQTWLFHREIGMILLLTGSILVSFWLYQHNENRSAGLIISGFLLYSGFSLANRFLGASGSIFASFYGVADLLFWGIFLIVLGRIYPYTSPPQKIERELREKKEQMDQNPRKRVTYRNTVQIYRNRYLDVAARYTFLFIILLFFAPRLAAAGFSLFHPSGIELLRFNLIHNVEPYFSLDNSPIIWIFGLSPFLICLYVWLSVRRLVQQSGLPDDDSISILDDGLVS